MSEYRAYTIGPNDHVTASRAFVCGNDDDAMPDMTADELEQARQYIIRGEGAMPVRKWHMLRKSTRTLSVVTHP